MPRALPERERPPRDDADLPADVADLAGNVHGLSPGGAGFLDAVRWDDSAKKLETVLLEMRIETEGLSDSETFHQAEARRIHVRKALVVISA